MHLKITKTLAPVRSHLNKGTFMKNLIKLVSLMLVIGAMCQTAEAVCAIVYDGFSFQGTSYVIGRDTSNSWLSYWNDRISSAIISPGCQLTVYSDANFYGDSETYLNNVLFMDRFNKRASSFECVCS